MPKRWNVTVIRAEKIVFEVEAETAEQAADLYLAEGDEVAADTTTLRVIDVKEITS